MAGTQLAAPKLPALKPGQFRFVTKSLGVEGEPGKRRFKTIASSTIKDMVADEIKMSALEDMVKSFTRGLNIFIEHRHDAEMIFGRSDTAQIIKSDEVDTNGAPIWDLHIGGVVNEPNPRARRLADSIDGGYVTFGTSIGAIVKDFKRNADGGMDIYHVDCKEASIVGIPQNQRSWTYKAAKAAAALETSGDPVSDDEDDDDDADETPNVADTMVEAAAVEESPHEEVTPEVGKAAEVTADDSAVIAKADGACPSCKGDKDDNPDCIDDWHNSTEKAGVDPEDVKHVTEPADRQVEPIEDTTPGGQEADAATPETAPTDGDDAAAPADDVQKAADFAEEDVVALVERTKSLVIELGGAREEVVALKKEIAGLKGQHERLAAVEKDAVEAIEKVMALPLQRKAVGHVTDLVTRYPDVFDPRVTAYLERSTTQERK